MKLVDLLARELESWPGNGCVALSQDMDRMVYFWRNNEIEFDGTEWSSTVGGSLCERCWSTEKISEHLATDHSTAIITREMWQAARDKLKGVKPVKGNKDGWLRHRGGKCPVADHVLIQARTRGGMKSTFTAGWFLWDHQNNSADVMSYRVVEADQVDFVEHTDEPPSVFLQYSGQGPLQWRDRIRAIDIAAKDEEARHCAVMKAYDNERAELVGKLKDEGLLLIE